MLYLKNDFVNQLEDFFSDRVGKLQDSEHEFDIENLCFRQQIDFIKSAARYKIARCSRRAGKTSALAYYLIYECLRHRRVNCLYISKTRQSAKDIIWKMLKEIINDNQIKVKTNETYLQIDFFKTESTIKIFGADSLREVEKRRGQRIRLAIIDECQLFPNYVQTLCDDILSLSLSDEQGTLCLTGTPEPSCSSYFHKRDHSDGFEKHHWTWRDNKYYIDSALLNNPSLKTPDDIMLQDIFHKGQQVTDPAVRREWFGEWVRSEDLLIYNYDKDKCDYDTAPYLPHYVIGIDLGFNDADAIVAVGFSPEHRECYVVEEFKQAKQTITELAAHINYFKDKYKPLAIVIDGGALGKKIYEELNQRYAFGIIPAEKDRKFEAIAFINAEIRNGFIKIRDSSQLAGEMKLLTKDEEKFAQGILKEDDRYENHLSDCFAYSFRYIQNYRHKEPPPKKSYEELVSDKIRAERESAIEGRNRKHNDLFSEPGDSRLGYDFFRDWKN